jgi:hypothetical protein
LILRIFKFESDFVSLEFNCGSKSKIKKTKIRFNEEKKQIHHSDFDVENFNLVFKVSNIFVI